METVGCGSIMKIQRIAQAVKSDYYYLRPRSSYRVYLLPWELGSFIRGIPRSLKQGQLVSFPADSPSGFHFMAVIPNENKLWITFDDVPVSTDSGTVEMHLGCSLTSRSATDFRKRAVKARRQFVGAGSSAHQESPPHACFGYAQQGRPFHHALVDGLDPHSVDVEFHVVSSYREVESAGVSKDDKFFYGDNPSFWRGLREFADWGDVVNEYGAWRFGMVQDGMDRIRGSLRKDSRTSTSGASRGASRPRS